MNQPDGPLNNGDILYPLRVMAFITLLCMGYELSRPLSGTKAEKELLPAATSDKLSQVYEREGMQPWQRKASEKAIESYAATQEKKWQRWNEAMFERTD